MVAALALIELRTRNAPNRILLITAKPPEEFESDFLGTKQIDAQATDDWYVGPLYTWWQRNFPLASTETRRLGPAFTAGLATEEDSRPNVLSLVRAADRTAVGMRVVQPDADTSDELRQVSGILGKDAERDDDALIESELQLLHRGEGRTVAFDPQDESQGTKVWIGLVGPVLDALTCGTILLVDEIDASLHPHLVARLVDLFQNPETNPHCAQLVFNAHDTNVLGNQASCVLGRDQIWSTEKDEVGACRLFSLSEFRPRRDESIERGYLRGRYGGIPELDPTEFVRSVEDLSPLRSGTEE